ncbi:hypothetical protein [Oscillibacter sp.]|uniref:hypothetical protein n=1 Tax=Oscillibacter sp. TaxID=1945593 RepID=UPI0028A1DF41|nr:hypothetical protein [Oscillibacter sp.]
MNKKEGKTTKRIFASFLTAALLLGLLSVGAGGGGDEVRAFDAFKLLWCCADH